jgi:hypothetical protein
VRLSFTKYNSIGTKDQETKLIKTNKGVELYQWSQAETKWVKVLYCCIINLTELKIGDVVDAKSSGSKQVLYGKEYDYVFGMLLFICSCS